MGDLKRLRELKRLFALTSRCEFVLDGPEVTNALAHHKRRRLVDGMGVSADALLEWNASHPEMLPHILEECVHDPKSFARFQAMATPVQREARDYFSTIHRKNYFF